MSCALLGARLLADVTSPVVPVAPFPNVTAPIGCHLPPAPERTERHVVVVGQRQHNAVDEIRAERPADQAVLRGDDTR